MRKLRPSRKVAVASIRSPFGRGQCIRLRYGKQVEGCWSGRPEGGLHGETYAECRGGRDAIWQEELFADAEAPLDGQTWKVASGHLSGQMHGRMDQCEGASGPDGQQECF